MNEACEYANAPLPRIEQIGFVLNETEDFIAITDTIAEGVCGTVHSIPVALIVSQTTLEGENDNDYESYR
tara:strand:+ start:857 stop:1066 length:210 start_codon:yes stop_codon:yes gene_type:complete